MSVAKHMLEVGNDGLNVVVNHPDLLPDAEGVGHIIFSPEQARNFAKLLIRHAAEIDGKGMGIQP